MIVDINADVGEGCGDDAALFAIVSSANVACGGHAGDRESMRETVRLAADRGVAVGAHPSFADREHFGRREFAIEPEELYEALCEQIASLAAVARECSVPLRHVKAHGALYNLAARDPLTADVVSRATRDSGLRVLYGLAGGAQIASALRYGLVGIAEGFADRRYRDDGSLVPRTQPDAMIDDEEEAVEQVRALVSSGRVETICVHGDNPHAVAFARGVRLALQKHGVSIGTPGA